MAVASFLAECPISPKNGEFPDSKGSHRSSENGSKTLDRLPNKRGTRDMLTMNINDYEDKCECSIFSRQGVLLVGAANCNAKR
jgi:hypothetical protein